MTTVCWSAHDELRRRGALRDGDGAEYAPGSVAPASLISSDSSRRTSFESFRCGLILILVPTSVRGTRREAAETAERAERAGGARRAARETGERAEPRRRCSSGVGTLSPTLISASSLSVARMCGVESRSVSPVLRDGV